MERVTVQRLDSVLAGVAALEAQLHDLRRVLDTPTPSPQRVGTDTAAPRIDGDADREYLSIRELARRIPYAEQTIRNLMARGVFQLGEHYIKPRARVVFRWSKVRDWLEQQTK